MKYALLIYSNGGEWDNLSEDERNAVYAEYMAVSGTDGIVGLSGILQVRIGPGGWFGKGHLVSTRLNDDGRPHHDWSRASVHLVRDLSNEDFGEHAPRIDDDGTVTPPG